MPKPIKRSLNTKTEPITSNSNDNTKASEIITPSRENSTQADWLVWHFETKWKELIELDSNTLDSEEFYLTKVIQTITNLQPLIPFLPHTYPTPNFQLFLSSILPKIILNLNKKPYYYHSQVLNLIQLLLLRVDNSDELFNDSSELVNLFGILPTPEHPNNISKEFLNGNLLTILENYLLTKSPLPGTSNSLPNFKPLIIHYILKFLKFQNLMDRPPPYELFFNLEFLPAPSLEVIIKNSLECDGIGIQKFMLDCLVSTILQGNTLPLSIYPCILNLLHKHTSNPSIHLNESLLTNLIFIIYSYGTSYPTLITQSSLNYELKLLGVPPLEKQSPTFGIEIFKRLTHYLPRCWSIKVRKFGYLIIGSLGKFVFNFPDNNYFGEQLIAKVDKLPPWKLNQSNILNTNDNISDNNNFNEFENFKTLNYLEYLTSELNREFIDHRVQGNLDNRRVEELDHHEPTASNNTNNNNEEESNSVDYLPTQGDHIISDTRTKVLSSKVTGGIGFGIEDIDHLVRISSLSSLSALTIYNSELIPKVINFTLERLLDPIKLVSIAALDCLLEIQISSNLISDSHFTSDKLINLVRSLSTSSNLLKEKIFELLGIIRFTSGKSVESFLAIFQQNLKPKNLEIDKLLIIRTLEQIGKNLTIKLNPRYILDKFHTKSDNINLNFPKNWNFGVYSLILNYLLNLNNREKLNQWNNLSNYYKNGLIYVFNLKFKNLIINKSQELGIGLDNNVSGGSVDRVKAQILSPLPNSKELPQLIAYSIGAELNFSIIFTNLKLNELSNISLQFKLSDNTPKLQKLSKFGEFKISRVNNWVKFESKVKLGFPSIEGNFFIRFNLVNQVTGEFINISTVGGDAKDDDVGGGSGNSNNNEEFGIINGRGSVSNEINTSWGIWLRYNEI